MTIDSTDSQKTLLLAVGWIGSFASVSEIPFVGRLMYRPAVLNEIPLDPRCDVTRTVIFAWFAIRPLCGVSGAPRPCRATSPGMRNCGTPLTVSQPRGWFPPDRTVNVSQLRRTDDTDYAMVTDT